MSRRVFLLGATGTIGRATLRALLQRGHEVVSFQRSKASSDAPAGAVIRQGEVTDPQSIARDGFRGEHFDAIVSCMASRSGAPKDAWAIDHQAHVNVLEAARAAGVSQMVLLSAICVQKPRLAFQHAKLAFERRLIESGLRYSIVRPTAYFKSLSGQIERLRSGKPFLVFGNGQLTACKPISDDDLGAYLADCLDDQSRWNRILPIGGPGHAQTPREQGEQLFGLLGMPPKFREIPVGLLDAIVGTLSAVGCVLPAAANKAELARIGRYYATESMLVWDEKRARYDADATPSTGSETLHDYHAQLVNAGAAPERGDHAVF